MSMRTISPGQLVPCGISRRIYGGYVLRIPLFPWFGNRYDAVADIWRRDWHVFNVIIHFYGASA